jgi:hypothetical protein
MLSMDILHVFGQLVELKFLEVTDFFIEA